MSEDIKGIICELSEKTNKENEEMKYEQYKKQRADALEAFQEFIKTLPGKGFTVQQLEIIGRNAQREVERIVADIKGKLVLTQDLSDLLK